MTVLEVKEAVLGYGFAPDLEENDVLFCTALNLAVKEINRIRPRTDTIVLVHEPVAPVYEMPDVTICHPGKEISLSCSARSAAFEVSGTGGVIVTGATINGNDRASWSANGGWVRLAAVSPTEGEIKLSFAGEDAFYIRNVAFFDIPLPPSSITGGDTVDYDLKAVAPSLARVVLPILKDGVPMLANDPKVILLHDYILRLPKDARGTYEIQYEPYPRRFGVYDDREEIPLDDDLSELVPLLVASFVWLEDDASKAARYDSLYRAAAANIEKRTTIPKWVDRTGWA